MQQSLVSVSPHITVSSPDAPYVYMTNWVDTNVRQVSGDVRFNPHLQRTEVWTGNQWQSLAAPSAHIGLNPDTEAVLKWARDRMQQEQQQQELAKKYPTLNDLLQQKQELQEKITAVTALLQT